MHDRWGSPPDVDGPYTSGCQEEFELAKLCLGDPEKPMADIVLLFRGLDPSRYADPGLQLTAVLEFKKEVEASKRHLFGTFEEGQEFRKLLQKHLARWVFAHEKGEPLPLLSGA